MLRKIKKGFTLIELVVVVAIIGVLVLLGLRTYVPQKERAFNSIAKANASTIQTMLVGYMGDHEITTTGDLTNSIQDALSAPAHTLEKMVNPYDSNLDVYRISTSASGFDDASGLTPTAVNGMVDISLVSNNVLEVNARGAKAELVLDNALPANKY